MRNSKDYRIQLYSAWPKTEALHSGRAKLPLSRIRHPDSGSAGASPSQEPQLMTDRSISRGTSPTRSGSTMVEVMVSLLITAIGIVGVASIFPVAVLRAVQATRLNKSVLVRQNMEQLIDIDPRIVHDPNGDGIFSVHNDTNYVVDPLGHMIMENTKDTNEVGALGGLNNVDALPRMGLGTILDPLTQKRTAGPPPIPVTSTQDINRLTFKAADFVTLSDTWLTQTEAMVNITAASTIDVSGTDIAGNLSEISISDPLAVSINQMPSRVIVSSPDGKVSVTRMIVDITGTTLTLDSPLPVTFVGILRVIVETKEFRYSTMLTVRKSLGNGTPAPSLLNNPQFGGLITDANYSNNGTFQRSAEIGKASVDIVVFVNRRFNRADETIYSVNSVTGGAGDESGRLFKVVFGANPRPAMKRGGFMLDPRNARWYRIEKIDQETPSSARILLETAAHIGETITKGIFMKGVIEVYPIGDK